MNRQEVFTEITQPALADELWSRLRTVLSSLYTESEGYTFVKQAGWVAAPHQGYWHTNAENRERLLQALLERGYTTLYALPTELGEPGLPLYSLAASTDGLAAFASTCGSFNYALFAGSPDWLFLFASDDFSVITGLPDFVCQVLGRDVSEAFASYLDYASKPFWKAHGSLLLYVHHQLLSYLQAAPGTAIHIGPTG